MTVVEVRTPRGNAARMAVRDGTSDLSTVGATFAGVAGSGLVDEYDLRSLHVSGTFLDVGGHIGTVAVAVLLDNPDATAVIVEPLPENVDMIRRNLELNGLRDRAVVEAAAVGATEVRYDTGVHRFIGNIGGASGKVAKVPMFSGITPKPQAVKTDAEGGEWALFPLVLGTPLIFGEWHGKGEADLLAALPGYWVDAKPQDDGTGLFRAVRA